MNKAVFLDRDGVINKVIVKNSKAYSPRYFEDFKFFPDVISIQDDTYRIIIFFSGIFFFLRFQKILFQFFKPIGGADFIKTFIDHKSHDFLVIMPFADHPKQQTHHF